jgi:hypothetical protein
VFISDSPHLTSRFCEDELNPYLFIIISNIVPEPSGSPHRTSQFCEDALDMLYTCFKIKD